MPTKGSYNHSNLKIKSGQKTFQKSTRDDDNVSDHGNISSSFAIESTSIDEQDVFSTDIYDPRNQDTLDENKIAD